ncbi:hypothetical protein NM208_g14929 [Fusarium decemcellulare]|uniref:Uncharacterized protein n=1 Tax=Fusarium decemcellulare TaxID=57161 RepID=A0ACC1RGC1_9HYPO|nr:hypothetical protein NM208_g14929 [Fusarium decemcellulare]
MIRNLGFNYHAKLISTFRVILGNGDRVLAGNISTRSQHGGECKQAVGFCKDLMPCSICAAEEGYDLGQKACTLALNLVGEQRYLAGNIWHKGANVKVITVTAVGNLKPNTRLAWPQI